MSSSPPSPRLPPGVRRVPVPPTPLPRVTEDDCIAACQAAMEACETCASACLNDAAVGSMRLCIEQCWSAADYCALTARELARSSEFSRALSTLCGEVCASCAEACRAHTTDVCGTCAEICSRCAHTCAALAGPND